MEHWTLTITFSDGHTETRNVRALYQLGAVIVSVVSEAAEQHGSVTKIEAV